MSQISQNLKATHQDLRAYDLRRIVEQDLRVVRNPDSRLKQEFEQLVCSVLNKPEEFNKFENLPLLSLCIADSIMMQLTL